MFPLWSLRSSPRGVVPSSGWEVVSWRWQLWPRRMSRSQELDGSVGVGAQALSEQGRLSRAEWDAMQDVDEVAAR